MRELPVTVDLSPALMREIGRVITHHAMLDWRLGRAIYALAGVNPKIGRLAIIEPSAPKKLDTILALARARNIDLRAKDKDLSLLRQCVKSVTEQRDQLAHGIWIKHPSFAHPVLRIVRGEWPPIKGQKQQQPKSRKIDPEAVPITSDGLRVLVELISETINLAAEIDSEIHKQLRALQHKPDAPLVRAD